MDKVVILVHAYNIDNSEETVGKLRGPFETLGYYVESLNYGYIPNVRDITKRNPSNAKRLADRVTYWQENGFIVDVVGHSNGCTIGHIATEEYEMCVNTFVAINPALTVDLNPSRTAKLVQVWYNEGDMVVIFGKWLNWLTPWARNHRPWGEQGRMGYTGTDKNVAGFDAAHGFKEGVYGHSAIFYSDFFLTEIARRCSLMTVTKL